MVELPSFVDSNGNIHLHSREGLVLPISSVTNNIEDDISTSKLFFEIEDYLRKELLLDGGNPLGRMLVLSPNDIRALPINRKVSFAMIDETGTQPIVLWEGKIEKRGW